MDSFKLRPFEVDFKAISRSPRLSGTLAFCDAPAGFDKACRCHVVLAVSISGRLSFAVFMLLRLPIT